MRRLVAYGLLVFATSGCVRKMALNAQIEAARDARAAVSTLHDYEVAREVTLSGLGQLEMLHRMAPNNEDALLLLAQAWTGAAAGFIEDDYERALDSGDPVAAEYHRRRARAAYERALHYGSLLLPSGFDEVRGNADDLVRWLSENVEDSELALVLGQAWLGRVGVSREDAAVVAERYVGVLLLERSVALNSAEAFGLARAILAGYAVASGDLDGARQRLQGLDSGYLPQRLVEARLLCLAGDAEAWEKSLRAIVSAGDPLPAARLQNVIAMRRARRYLMGERWRADCKF